MVVRCELCKRKINLEVENGQLGTQLGEHLARFHHIALQSTLTVGGAASLLLQFEHFADMPGDTTLADQRDALFEEVCDALGIDDSEAAAETPPENPAADPAPPAS